MSDALRKLQERCGAVADGAFGKNTAKAIAEHFELSSKRAAHLLGQVVHESGTFKYTEENLNYSVDACLRVFGKYFKSEEEAKPYARNPKALADKVYGHRGGNEGQGFVWRGRGFLQLTFRDNYRAFASDMRLPDVMDNPDLVASDYAMESAIWYFRRNNLWTICDQGVTDEVIKKVTKRVNGGYNGLDHRIKETHKIFNWLK
jgi:putative chitinase|tara:strand:- start:99 stop:707 length:609 start_codon:yes stop_codon:yes gene_type:complete